MAAERLGDRPYLTFPGRAFTFSSVIDPVASVAAALRDRYGVGPGDRVAISAANSLEWVLTFWAATTLGAITVALNGWWTGPETAYGLELTRPRVLLGDARRLDRLAGTDIGLPIVRFEEEFADLEAHQPGAALPDTPLDEDDPFLILFTSGTTGRPKGALISHRSNIHFIQSSLMNGAVHPSIYGGAGPVTPGTTTIPCVINASPLFHVSGLNCQVVMSMQTGMHIVYPPVGKWREDTHLRLTEQHRATAWSLVPTQLWRILEHPDLASFDLSSMQSVGGGGAVWAPELLRTLGEKLPLIRPSLGMGYGSTETNGLGTTLRAPNSWNHPDSIGFPSPGVELRISPPGSSEALAENEVGEICLRTPAAFLGYWDNPEATRQSLDEERWYRTGDFGHVTDRFVYLEGRRRDLIIRGGENIYPAEIENRLLEHPEIAEVAVIGVVHATLGQEVKAVVVPRQVGALSVETVRAWAGEALAPFKVPTIVEFIDALPYNASGKVMKHLLEEPSTASGFIAE